MTTRIRLRQLGFGPLVAALSFLLLGACGEADTVGFKDDVANAGEPQLVYSVAAIDVAVMESLPLQLSISAQGHARTGGWSEPALEEDVEASGAGLLVFNFLAVRPAGIATQAITPIAASTTYGPWTDRMAREIRVVAETNSQSYFFPSDGGE